ncbi:MAG TPA: FAD-dependent monooxygenase, partial [Pirellulaceae bacterium]
MPREPITIVGAGLVGSLLAAMLGQRGHAVRVFEKRPDLRCERIPAGRSINLALAERGLHALRIAGLAEQVQALLIPMRGRMLHLAEGQVTYAPYGQRADEVIYSISRLELNQLLLSAAEATGRVELHFQATCEQVDLARQELWIRDERAGHLRQEPYARVLGADGSASVLRAAIISRTGGTCRYDRLDHDYKELSIPASAGGDWQMERDALHIWPRGGFMLIALPNRDGSFTVTLFLAHAGSPSFADLITPT